VTNLSAGPWQAAHLGSSAIDLSAALLTFVSLTGLILIYFIHKHRFSGLLALAGGAAVAGLVYAFFVP
jgi:hypothetical protein